jgi:hypothetical protein
MLRKTFALEDEEVKERWEKEKSMQLVLQFVVVI